MILEKLSVATFPCSCGKESFIKSDKGGKFPDWMQCCYCEAYLSVFSNIMSPKINVVIMDEEKVAWLKGIEERAKDTSTPLRIYRTKENAL